MQIYSPTAIKDLKGFKLDCLSQPLYASDNKSVSFRAEAGNFVVYFGWSVVSQLIDAKVRYALSVGCSEREQLAKDLIVVAGFEREDNVKTFVAAAQKLGIIIPKDWECLVEIS